MILKFINTVLLCLALGGCASLMTSEKEHKHDEFINEFRTHIDKFNKHIKKHNRKMKILYERIRDLENEVYLKKYTPKR